MAINNIYTDGIASGWKVHDASTFKANRSFEADVAIVGTGAGGGTAAEILSLAGLKVLLLEEGPLKTSDSFKDMDESRAYADLYQEGGARASFLVRKISNGFGVERSFLIHSPRVEKIDVTRRGLVRRAKLFYLRGKVGKAARIKEKRNY